MAVFKLHFHSHPLTRRAHANDLQTATTKTHTRARPLLKVPPAQNRAFKQNDAKRKTSPSVASLNDVLAQTVFFGIIIANIRVAREVVCLCVCVSYTAEMSLIIKLRMYVCVCI